MQKGKVEEVIYKFNNVKPQNLKVLKKKTQHSIFIWENLSLVIRCNREEFEHNGKLSPGCSQQVIIPEKFPFLTFQDTVIGSNLLVLTNLFPGALGFFGTV